MTLPQYDLVSFDSDFLTVPKSHNEVRYLRARSGAQGGSRQRALHVVVLFIWVRAPRALNTTASRLRCH
jgi:hypothetical protein